MITKKHHLTPIETLRGLNGHSAFYCSVNDIVIYSNNDTIGDKWHLGAGESTKTKWFASPTLAAIDYYDKHN